MKVEHLLKYLATLEQPLRVTGASRAANDLADACRRLQPFADLTVAQFGEFLAHADHYAKTGQVPVKAGRATRKSAAPDPEKIKKAAQTVTSLYERAIDASLDYAQIEAELKRLNKQLTKDEAIAVAREVNIAKTLKTKKAAIETMQAWIFDRKQSFQRTAF